MGGCRLQTGQPDGVLVKHAQGGGSWCTVPIVVGVTLSPSAMLCVVVIIRLIVTLGIGRSGKKEMATTGGDSQSMPTLRL